MPPRPSCPQRGRRLGAGLVGLLFPRAASLRRAVQPLPRLPFGPVYGDVLTAQAHGHVVGVDLLPDGARLVSFLSEAAGELQRDIPLAGREIDDGRGEVPDHVHVVDDARPGLPLP